MAELPNCTGREVVAALGRLGYRSVRQSGSHVRLKCPGRASLTIPVHLGKDLAKGILRDIISKVRIHRRGVRGQDLAGYHGRYSL